MNKFFKISSVAAAIAFLGFYSCSDDDSTSTEEITNASVINNYSDLVYQNYLESYNSAVEMQTAINSFVASPSEAGLEAAKTAWLSARDIYGQTEAFRECNGPVDSEGESWSLGTEGQMNAWPIDESFIDYVAVGSEDYAGTFTSIIGDTATYPSISESVITDLNESQTDKSISTGWHAIEFLLWGQDETLPSENLPGQREYTDYTTADNADRRGAYLQAATDLLVSDLNDLVTTWADGGSYRTVFESLDENTALTQLLTGPFFIAGDELSSERMIVPVDSNEGIDNSGQEFEHSCFADNTNNDVWANAQGVYNVVFGSYSNVSGTSFYDLVNATDADQAVALKTAAAAAMEKVNVLKNGTEPFDLLITRETATDANFGPVMQAVEALQDWADVISESASVIGVNLQ